MPDYHTKSEDEHHRDTISTTVVQQHERDGSTTKARAIALIRLHSYPSSSNHPLPRRASTVRISTRHTTEIHTSRCTHSQIISPAWKKISSTMSTNSKRTTAPQPTGSRSKPRLQIQRGRTKKAHNLPTQKRKLPTQPAVVSPPEIGRRSTDRAAKKKFATWTNLILLIFFSLIRKRKNH